MHNTLRLTILLIIIFTSISACASYNANNLAEKEHSSKDRIKKLETELSALKKQLQMLSHNQQTLAKHIGINAQSKNTNQQPTLNLDNSISLGNKNASVALIEFTDLHCPFCKKFHSNTFNLLQNKYIKSNKLLFVGKHYPIAAIHKNAVKASKALECAVQLDSENSYLPAKSWLFDIGSNFKLKQFAQDLSLDNQNLSTCLQSEKLASKIASDISLAKSIGVNSTPSFVIGLHKKGEIKEWKIIKGAKTFEQFSQAIDHFIVLANEKESN